MFTGVLWLKEQQSSERYNQPTGQTEVVIKLCVVTGFLKRLQQGSQPCGSGASRAFFQLLSVALTKAVYIEMDRVFSFILITLSSFKQQLTSISSWIQIQKKKKCVGRCIYLSCCWRSGMCDLQWEIKINQVIEQRNELFFLSSQEMSVSSDVILNCECTWLMSQRGGSQVG